MLLKRSVSLGRPAEHPLLRLSVDLGPDAVMGAFVTAAISPDGAPLIYEVKTQPSQTINFGTLNQFHFYSRNSNHADHGGICHYEERCAHDHGGLAAGSRR